MARPRLYDIDALAGTLYDRLAGMEIRCEHGIRGLTVDEIATELDVPQHIARRVIRQQRLIFGADDEINLPYHVCGLKRLYHLAASIDAGERWMTIRMRNELSQIAVSKAWWQSLQRAHPASGVVALNLAAYGEIETRVKLLLGDMPL